ncbi:class I SAM-dependent methyltransferase [Sphingomonas sp. Leaf24]|uniref:class I SAM-dependent methyltransferase n=1 Tax=unclassified Sphingomonas TaxID=196159 RepID=UPI002E105123
MENSCFFDRKFDAAVAIGLLFLLPEPAQAALIARVGRTLKPGGRFLFGAPRIACTWRDTLTGRTSRSLGETAYRALLADAGLHLAANYRDNGGNDYGMAVAGQGGEA